MLAVLFLLTGLSLSVVTRAGALEGQALEDLLDATVAAEFPQVWELAVAADGRRAAVVLQSEDVSYLDYYVDVRKRLLVVADLESGAMRRHTEPAEDAHRPAWFDRWLRLPPAEPSS